MWTIVIERECGISNVLTEFGHQVQRHDHRAVNTGCTNYISGMIKNGTIAMLVSELPIVNCHVLERK